MTTNETLNILVCALANASTNPRPNRMIQFLSKQYNVGFLGFQCNIEGIKFHPLIRKTSITERALRFFARALKLHSFTRFSSYNLLDSQLLNRYDIVICHDIELLPFILANGKQCKIIFDAREFYPRQFENKLLWKILHAPFQQFSHIFSPQNEYQGRPHHKIH